MKKHALLLLALALAFGCRRKPRSPEYYYAPPPPPTMSAPPPPPSASVAPLPAQVTDADRAAARDLFSEGAQLQQQGKLAEALDRFQRSNSVFPAPTTLLRIAQCQVGLGKMIEGGEAYRAILNTKIPAGSPQAFTDAQTTAGAELAQLEPRVPRVKLVAAEPVTQITLDGQPFNLALLGVARPLNPGTHRVLLVSAKGTSEQVFDVKEREQKEVKLTPKR